MALSNRDRVGQMFEILSPELDAFIQKAIGPELPEGAEWTSVVALRDKEKGIEGKQYSRTDPQVQLRMLTQNVTGQVKKGWYPFSAHLNQSQMGLASELFGVRNSWAHNDPFSNDDAYRALDTAERLLKAISAGGAADRVQKLRLDLRRVTADKDDKRTVKNAAVNATSAGLMAWRDVLRPHEDVATGNFQASEFAADLFKVATGDKDQSRDYTDPTEFFNRTYLTEGLRDLIGRAVRRLAGDQNASPVINLQTNFGGGKTHSMLSLWHLASGTPITAFPQDVQELLDANGYQNLPAGVNRVAIVGNHFAASGEPKDDGTRVNTVWGELAWQLGGSEAYQLVADADRTSTAPGAALHELLRRYSPAVILIDEWVAYARQLYGKDDLAGGTFDTQFTFAQSLTEAVKATPGVLVAISIPASHNASDGDDIVAGSEEEVGGSNGIEALRRLQNVVRRVADQWRPASSEESYQIVRQRLFVEPKGEQLALISATASEFGDMYRKYSSDFPRESHDKNYEDRIKRSYPIHPELFDRLYQDWSVLERFQRTRGVLRLMNTVIHALWVAGDQSPLILPGSIPLSVSSVNSELTQYLSDSWKPIIDADVDGERSVPAEIDQAKTLFGQRSLTKRLARTVFFGAVPTIGSAHKGLETQRVFLGTAVPGDVPGNFHSALNQLGDKATYFYSGGGKYWYDIQANISRTAKDQAERLHDEDVWAEIVARLQTQRKTLGSFAGVQVAPENSADIPDVDEARLIIVHPKASYSRKRGADSDAAKFAHAATEKRGTANRTHRNMVVFLAPDADRLGELANAVRDYLGWRHVHDKSDELDLTAQQVRQAVDKRDRASQTVEDRLLGAYHWVLVAEQPIPGQPFSIAPIKAEGSAGSLAERVSKRLLTESALNTERAARLIRLDLQNHLPTVWETGHVSVSELWSYYTGYSFMPRLRDRDVLDLGIQQFGDVLMWQSDSFAVAESVEGGVYQGLVLPSDNTPIVVHNSLLLVRPDVAEAQREREVPAPTSEPEAGTEPDPTQGDRPSDRRTTTGTPSVVTSPDSPATPTYTRFFGTRVLDSQRYAADFSKITNEVIQHLAGVDGAEVEVRIEITAKAAGGFDENKRRTVQENANTLKFEQSSFEER